MKAITPRLISRLFQSAADIVLAEPITRRFGESEGLLLSETESLGLSEAEGLASQIEKLKEANNSLKASLQSDNAHFVERFIIKPKHPSRRISVRE